MSLARLKVLAGEIGLDHSLALGLWASGWRDARMLACFVDDPASVTPAQMDRWCRTFDNWGICDTACFVLFDRTPHAWARVGTWARRKPEFERRAAFALLWSLSVHDKAAPDRRFIAGLGLIERAATDDRRYVRLAVDMALRAIGKRNPALHKAALRVARRLGASADPSASWVGRHAASELENPAVVRRVVAKGRRGRG